MRISAWSSDVCSSDLIADMLVQVCVLLHVGARRILRSPECVERGHRDELPGDPKGGACGPHVLWIREIVRIDERRRQRVTRRDLDTAAASRAGYVRGRHEAVALDDLAAMILIQQIEEVVLDVGIFELRAGLEEGRSEEHTSELQSLMRISYAVFCLKKKIINKRVRN